MRRWRRPIDGSVSYFRPTATDGERPLDGRVDGRSLDHPVESRHVITATGLELRAGTRILLADTSLRLHHGDRVGLVGRNGAGKTTTLRVLAGEGLPHGGRRHQHRCRSATSRRTRARATWTSPPRTGCCPRAVWTCWSRELEKVQIQMSELTDAARAGRGHRAVRPDRGAVLRARRVRRRIRGRPDLLQPRPAGPGAGPDDEHAVRRPAAPGRAGPDPVRRPRRGRLVDRHDAAARRADQPPGRRLHRLAARLPASTSPAAW